VLKFDLGLVAGRMGVRPLAVTLRITGSKGATKKLLEHHLGALQAGRWFPVRFDLSPYAGQIVTLRFSVPKRGPETQHMGAVAVGRPVLQSEAPRSRPNLIVVVLDTVRHDALSCYVGPRTHTPNLDGVAKRGALFVNAFTNAAWTRPSLMALFSSRYPYMAGSTPRVFRVNRVDRWYLRHGKVPTLFSHLAGQGYVTRGLVNNFFMLPHERVGHDHGLSSFAHILFDQGPKRRDNPTITAGVERFLAAHKRHRFFLYVLYESAHSPYKPPATARRRMRAIMGLKKRKIGRRSGQYRRLDMMERYRAEVINLDDHVGRILASLKKHGLTDNTYVVITSDHGEVISRQHCFFIPRLNYRSCYSHSASLYEQVLHVPVVIQGPALSPGRRIEQSYQHVDLVPTVLELMGLPGLPGPWARATPPASARPRGCRPSPGTFMPWAVGSRPCAAVGTSSSCALTGPRASSRAANERWNIAQHKPQVVARLRDRLKPFLKRDRVPELPTMPRTILRQLRARQALYRIRFPRPHTRKRARRRLRKR